MRSRSPLSAAFVLTLASSLLAFFDGSADAAPLPAPYSGATHSDVVLVEAGVEGGPSLATAEIGHTVTDVDTSRLTQDARASAANLSAAVAGLALPIDGLSVAAAPDGTAGRDLSQVDVPGLLHTGLLTGSVAARYEGDASCVLDTPIAESRTRLAALTVSGSGSPRGVATLASLQAVDTTGRTMLGDTTTSGARPVVSSSMGSIADFSLLDGRVSVDVGSDAVLEASSDGNTGSVRYTAPVVAVRVDGGPAANLTAGGAPLQRTVALAGLATAQVTLHLGDLTDASAGAVASASVPAVLDVRIDVSALGAPVSTAHLSLLPLRATAVAPRGGVECEGSHVSPDPVATDPATDPATADPTATDPATDSATADPTATGPVATEPVVTDPTATDLGTIHRTPSSTVPPNAQRTAGRLPETGSTLGSRWPLLGLLLCGAGGALTLCSRARRPS